MRHAILLAVLLAGCRQQGTPLANPFLAPSRVAPPATRTPPPGAAVPYYDGAAPPPAAAPGPSQSSRKNDTRAADARALAAVSPNALQSAASAERRNSQEEPISIPTDDGRERLVRVASHEEADVPNGGRPPRPFPDIADLPEVTAAPRAHRPEQRDRPRHGSGLTADATFRPQGGRSRTERVWDVQTASFETSSPAAESRAPETDTRDRPRSRFGRQRYGYASDYRWLRGRLEHSQAADQWKLRYIPIDGETDDYGGSVILANPVVLGEYAAGDFVHVEGAHVEDQGGDLSFAPVYRIQQIRPLAD